MESPSSFQPVFSSVFSVCLLVSFLERLSLVSFQSYNQKTFTCITPEKSSFMRYLKCVENCYKLKTAVKYSRVKLFPIDSNGGSTGLAPIQVNTKKILTNDQNLSFDIGLNFLVLFLIRGKSKNTLMEASRATTPPSLEGIDRRMAYANRKYHSGWI